MFNKSQSGADGKAPTRTRAKRHPFRWVAFVFFVLCVSVYFPSIASLVFLLAALLICPIRRFREVGFMQRMEGDVASFGLPTNLVVNVVATALFLLGTMIAPSSSGATRSAPRQTNDGLLSVTGDIEYSHDPVNIFDYVVCSDQKAKLEATNDVVASEVGSQVVTIKISRSIFRNSEEDVELIVRDTQSPTIELTEDSVEVMMGDPFDATSNVKAVTDPVDGELAEVQEEPRAKQGEVGLDRLYDEGWYLVSSADTSKVGEQEVTVQAVDQHGNEATASYQLKVVDPFEDVHFNKKTSDLEYSNKKLDPTKLIKCSDPEVSFTADKISLNKVGDIKVTYTLTKGNATKKEVRTFHVRDTKEPHISIGQDELSIEQGESFDPYGNVVSVEDEVDGPLERVQEERSDNGNGWYTVQGSYDVNVPSKYFFTVIACDRNGNRVTKEFSLLVKDPPAPEASSSDQGYSAPVHDYIVNTNTGKFHYPYCRDVNKMNESNKSYVTATRDEIIGWGYSPCGHCHP